MNNLAERTKKARKEAGLSQAELAKAIGTGQSTIASIDSENIEEYPDEERHDLRKAAETITVCGKVLAWWTLMQG